MIFLGQLQECSGWVPKLMADTVTGMGGSPVTRPPGEKEEKRKGEG